MNKFCFSKTYIFDAPSGNRRHYFFNLVVRHLEMDETLEECAVRECREEGGVILDKRKLRFLSINSDPTDNPRQKVSVVYGVLLENTQPG